MQLRLCAPTLTVQVNETDVYQLKGRLALLIRIVAQWQGKSVPTEPIAVGLGIAVKSVPRYGRDANTRVLKHPLLTHTGKDGITLSPDLTTDADEFKRLADEAAALADGRDFATLGVQDARDIAKILDDARAIWQGSPATGMDAVAQTIAEALDPTSKSTRRQRAQAGGKRSSERTIDDPETLRAAMTDLETEFAYWVYEHLAMTLLWADCRLVAGTSRSSLNDVALELTPLASRTHTQLDTRVWLRLLTATRQMEGSKARHRALWERARRTYEEACEDFPEQLLTFAPSNAVSRSSPTPQNSREPMLSRIVSDEDLNVLDLTTRLGIHPTSALELEGSRLEPKECIERAEHTLCFSGVLANKWVGKTQILSQFRAMLTRFQDLTPVGQARFLVLDPESESYQRLYQMRAGATSLDSINLLVDLSREFDCFEVRGFDHLPTFRVIIIDDDLVSFSPYDLENEAVQSTPQGWTAPHVVLDPHALYPLAPAFRAHFDTEWASATPLTKEYP